MNPQRIEEIEKQYAEAKAKQPDWSDPFFMGQLVPYLVTIRRELLKKMVDIDAKDAAGIAKMQGQVKAITDLIEQPQKQAEYEQMVSDALAKWKPKEKEENDTRGDRGATTATGAGSAGWAATAARRFIRR